MTSYPYDIILIGGSAGSLDQVMQIAAALPGGFATPVVLIIHRLKNTESHLDRMVAKNTAAIPVREPEDKEPVRSGTIYLAPQNYHLLAEADHTFSLDYSEPVHYSRPSIDVAFESFAGVYGSRMLAVLLSGANTDGAAGMGAVIARGGTALVQSPETASYAVMPEAALRNNGKAISLSVEGIIQHILGNT